MANVASLASRRSQAKLTHLYKIVNELADYPNAPLLPKMHHYNSRRSSSRQFVQHRARTTQFQRSFFLDTIKNGICSLQKLWQYNLYQVSRNISCNINFCNCPFPGYILELALLFMYASVCNNTGIVIEKIILMLTTNE